MVLHLHGPCMETARKERKARDICGAEKRTRSQRKRARDPRGKAIRLFFPLGPSQHPRAGHGSIICASGLRGWTSVLLAQAVRARIPEMLIPCRFPLLPNLDGIRGILAGRSLPRHFDAILAGRSLLVVPPTRNPSTPRQFLFFHPTTRNRFPAASND